MQEEGMINLFTTKKGPKFLPGKVVYMKGSRPFPNLLKRNISGSEANFRDFAGNHITKDKVGIISYCVTWIKGGDLKTEEVC